MVSGIFTHFISLYVYIPITIAIFKHVQGNIRNAGGSAGPSQTVSDI